MRHHELQKPLIQSALVLLAVFILIGFVAGSNAQTFFGGITSIFKGVLYTILFVFALSIAVAVSVALLIAIFLGAVALYSPEASKDMFFKLKENISNLYCTWSSCRSSCVPSDSLNEQPSDVQVSSSQQQSPLQTHQASVADDVKIMGSSLKEEIDGVAQELHQVSTTSASLEKSISELQGSISEIPVDDLSARTLSIEDKQNELASTLSSCQEQLDSIKAALSANENISTQNSAAIGKANEKMASYEAQLADLQDALENISTVEEETADEESSEHRIFTYLDKEEDKQKFASLVEEAIGNNLTYAEIDDFLTKSLTKKIDGIIKDHPSLTKDYIRGCKKK